MRPLRRGDVTPYPEDQEVLLPLRVLQLLVRIPASALAKLLAQPRQHAPTRIIAHAAQHHALAVNRRPELLEVLDLTQEDTEQDQRKVGQVAGAVAQNAHRVVCPSEVRLLRTALFKNSRKSMYILSISPNDNNNY